MKTTQIYEIVNDTVSEITGKVDLLKENLSNLVDVGNEMLNVSSAEIIGGVLTNKVGRIIFNAKKYSGRAPSVYNDKWEYGSIKQKISFKLPKATENESWQLVDGSSYDPNVYHDPQADTKYWNEMTTFEVPFSMTELMIKQSFSNASEMGSFLSGLMMYIENGMTIQTDALIMRTINNFTAEVISKNNANQVYHLLTLYNATHTEQLTAATALENPDFIRFFTYEITTIIPRLNVMSVLFNVEGKERYTATEDLHIVMLSDIMSRANIYLQSDVFHNELTQLPNAESVTYWQGSGKTYAFDDISKIDVVTSTGKQVSQSGILAVMFDDNALGVDCFNKRTTQNYNPKAEFTNYWFKQDARYFNDLGENFVVFVLD